MSKIMNNIICFKGYHYTVQTTLNNGRKWKFTICVLSNFHRLHKFIHCYDIKFPNIELHINTDYVYIIERITNSDI